MQYHTVVHYLCMHHFSILHRIVGTVGWWYNLVSFIFSLRPICLWLCRVLLFIE